MRSLRRVDPNRAMSILSGQNARYLAEIASASGQFQHLHNLGILKKQKTSDWTLISPFTRSHYVLARDPRDHIYGVLGLLDDADRDHPNLQPDYCLDMSQTYTKATRFLLHKLGLDKMLQLVVGPPRNINALPSWVPDWTTMKSFAHFDMYQTRQTFSSGGQQSPIWKVQIEEPFSVLSVYGRLADDIFDVCHTLDPEPATGLYGDITTRFFWRTHNIITDFRKHQSLSDVQSPSQAASSHLRTFMLVDSSASLQDFSKRLGVRMQQTLASNTDTADLDPVRARADGLDIAKPSTEPLLLSSYSTFAQLSEALSPLYDLNKLEKLSPEGKQYLWDHVSSLELMSWGLGFCMTKSGHMGLVPTGTAKTDKVCYMQGIRVPCILRAHPEQFEKYIFLGQCYIDGMMHGEAFPEGINGMQDIHLV